MNGAYTQRSHNRQQNRRHQNRGAAVIHQHADDNHKHVDHQQNDIFIAGDGSQEGQNHIGQILRDVKPAQNLNCKQHGHNNTGGTASLNQCIFKGMAIQLLIIEEAHGNGVNHRQGRRFRAG